MNEKEMSLFLRFSSGLKTKKEYLYVLNELMETVNKDLLEINSNDLTLYFEKLDNSINTKRKKYHQLFSFYNFLSNELVINKNPLRNIPQPKGNKQIQMERTLEFDDVRILLDIIREHFSFRDYVITLIIATTGIKTSEVLNIKLSDFIIDDNENIGLLIGNNNNKRYVKIFNFVWEKINEFRISLDIPDHHLKETYPLFFSQNQLKLYREYPAMVKPLSADWLKKIYTKACDMANLPLITAKDLRHNYTMLCMRLGSPIEDIKDNLGWSSTEFINRYHGVVELLNSPINEKVEEYYMDLLYKK